MNLASKTCLYWAGYKYIRSPVGFQMYFQSVELEEKLKCGLAADSFLKCTLHRGKL